MVSLGRLHTSAVHDITLRTAAVVAAAATSVTTTGDTNVAEGAVPLQRIAGRPRTRARFAIGHDIFFDRYNYIVFTS